MDRDNEIFLSGYVSQDYMKLLDNADRGSLAVPPEFCFALATTAVQGYNVISSDDTIKERLFSSSNQRLIFVLSIIKVMCVIKICRTKNVLKITAISNLSCKLLTIVLPKMN